MLEWNSRPSHYLHEVWWTRPCPDPECELGPVKDFPQETLPLGVAPQHGHTFHPTAAALSLWTRESPAAAVKAQTLKNWRTQWYKLYKKCSDIQHGFVWFPSDTLNHIFTKKQLQIPWCGRFLEDILFYYIRQHCEGFTQETSCGSFLDLGSKISTWWTVVHHFNH